MKAMWKGQVIAESDNTIVVESNHYFPADAIHKEFFIASDHTSICPWKGEASYFSVVVNGEVNKDAAWRYLKTSEKAKSIEGRVAFWRGVELVE